jgi:hypothetical protein
MEIRYKVVDIWDGHVRNVSLMPGVTYSVGGTYRVWFEERNDEKATELFEKIFARKLAAAQNTYSKFVNERTFKEVDE